MTEEQTDKLIANLKSLIKNELENKEVGKVQLSKEQAKNNLIELLESQIIDLTVMSKIKLEDNVIAEIMRLKEIINN